MKPPKIIAVGHIYKVTFPNGKIYVGQDRTDDICYFGSACRKLLTADFTRAQRRDFTIRKQILVELRNTTIGELNRREREYILRYRSNDPAVGYNRTPKGKTDESRSSGSSRRYAA